MKHTQGPWKHIRQRNTDDSHDIMANGICVATCGKQSCDDGVIAANARLIAAAPELLEACKQALFAVQYRPRIFAVLRDAIAKAEGDL